MSKSEAVLAGWVLWSGLVTAVWAAVRRRHEG